VLGKPFKSPYKIYNDKGEVLLSSFRIFKGNFTPSDINETMNEIMNDYAKYYPDTNKIEYINIYGFTYIDRESRKNASMNSAMMGGIFHTDIPKPEIIGKLDKRKPVYVLKIWRGSGYLLDFFAVNADSEEEAIENLGDYIHKMAAKDKSYADFIGNELNDDDIYAGNVYLIGENFAIKKYSYMDFTNSY
jgi:hypothetical protein